MKRALKICLGALVCLLATAVSALAASISLAWDPNTEPDIAGYVVWYGTVSGQPTSSVDVGLQTTWTMTSGTAGATYYFRVVAYNTAGESSAPSSEVSATLGGTPEGQGGTPQGQGGAPGIDGTTLYFGAVMSGTTFTSVTVSQNVHVTPSGSASWTATADQPWLHVTPASGSGPATLSVSVSPVAGLPAWGTANGTVTVTSSDGSSWPIAVTLTLRPQGTTAAPFGSVDTPIKNATGVAGSLAITGWALDDLDVTAVRIFRDPVGTEGGLMLVGNAVQVEGARPDVAAMFPSMPRASHAGWGYLLLTNMLPNRGNGTYKLYVYADDADGHSTLLDTRTITCANDASVSPFGAIDTPTQGGVVSGIVDNFGWVLSPGAARADGLGGGTVSVVIDGVVVGTPAQWSSRPDLTAAFPSGQYQGVNASQGVYTFDSRTLTNGVHTIAWAVTDNQGQSAGVGSRYFTVWNGASGSMAGLRLESAEPATNVVTALPLDDAPVYARRGYVLDAPYRRARPDSTGLITVQAEEIDRIDVRLSGAAGDRFSGYALSGGVLGALPVGSQLDPATGAFTWQPGVGFVGSYDLIFVRSSSGRAVAQQDVRIVLNTKGSGHVGPQIVIDTPTPQQTVAGPFLIAGWAADLDAASGTGIDAVHVWAYPVAGGNPVFVGAATSGGERPDVSAVYGDQFKSSGYGLIVQGLDPGTYDMAVFGWSSVTGGFVPARTVRVTVR